MMKSILNVRVGDTILEPAGGRTEVKKVDSVTCRHKVHINDKDCYEDFARVRIQD